MDFSELRKYIDLMEEAFLLKEELEHFPDCNLRRVLQDILNGFLNPPDVSVLCDSDPGSLNSPKEPLDEPIERSHIWISDLPIEELHKPINVNDLRFDNPILSDSSVFNIQTDGSLMDRLLSIFGVSLKGR